MKDFHFCVHQPFKFQGTSFLCGHKISVTLSPLHYFPNLTERHFICKIMCVNCSLLQINSKIITAFSKPACDMQSQLVMDRVDVSSIDSFNLSLHAGVVIKCVPILLSHYNAFRRGKRTEKHTNLCTSCPFFHYSWLASLTVMKLIMFNYLRDAAVQRELHSGLRGDAHMKAHIHHTTSVSLFY